MNPREWRILEIALVIVILTGFGIYAWAEIRRSHDLIAAAEAKSASVEAQRKADQAQAQKIADDQRQQIEELRSDFAKIKTAPQAAAALPTYFPTVGQPTIVTVPAQPATATTPALPATTQYVMSADQMLALAKQGEACKECTINLVAETNTNGLLREQLSSCQQETMAWKKAAKGGSLLHRLTHDLALTSTAILIGAVIGGGVAVAIKPWRNSNGNRGSIRGRSRSGPDRGIGDLRGPREDQGQAPEHD